MEKYAEFYSRTEMRRQCDPTVYNLIKMQKQVNINLRIAYI